MKNQLSYFQYISENVMKLRIIQFWTLWQPQNQYQTWIKWTRNILIWLFAAKVAWWNIIDQSWHLYTMQHGDKVIYPKYYENSNDLVIWLLFGRSGSSEHFYYFAKISHFLKYLSWKKWKKYKHWSWTIVNFLGQNRLNIWNQL